MLAKAYRMSTVSGLTWAIAHFGYTKVLTVAPDRYAEEWMSEGASLQALRCGILPPYYGGEPQVDQEPQQDKKHLTTERAAQAKARRLLAAVLERIPPQIGAPGAPGDPGAPESPREGHDWAAEGVERENPGPRW